ncbi:Cytochrome P450 2D16 [Varanus komodoensis]|nr:Cytochrome P450 2D16 [Varanus komodoensis]
MGLPLKTVRILQLVQNRAARLLTGAGHYVHMTPGLRQLHWLPIEVRAQFKVLVMTYKALNGLGPGYLKERLRPYMPDRPLRLAGEALLREPSVKEIRRHQKKKDPSSTSDKENLAQCIHDFFIAGTETTASSLKWALLLLTSHLDIQDNVYKEIEGAFGSTHTITYQDKKKLPYTNAVIHEMQRFKYILLMGVPRECAKDTNMRGFLIPKGTLIFPDLRSVLLDPEHWDTPEEFNPNQFLDKDGNFVAREEFLPFGAGARVCLGERLACMEIFLLLTRLLRAFRFQLPEGTKELSQKPIRGLATPPQPYKICAVPRCSSS